MNKILKLYVLLAITLPAYAHQYKECDIWYYLRAEAGASFSMDSHICANPIIWDPAVEGYNATLGTAPMVGLEGGVNFHEWLSLGTRVNFRSKFKYCKKQTSINASEPGFIGDKTRFFNLDNTSFMINLAFNRTEKSFGWEFCNFSINPFAVIGIGWGRTTLYNFHSQRAETVTVGNFTTNRVASIMSPNANNNFVWDGQLGLNFVFCKDLSVSIGYRYFDGGHFKSNNYLIDVTPDFDSPININAWLGKLRANELVIQLGIEW